MKGQTELARKLRAITPLVKEHINFTLKNSALMIHETATKSIKKISPGEPYVRYVEPGGSKSKRKGRASRPGDPPNTDTGNLVNNVLWEIDEDKMVAQVGTNLNYGYFLEEGTKTVAARPWLKPAYNKHKDKINKMLQSELKSAFKGAVK
jgi:HK97 gp10 family phage protein